MNLKIEENVKKIIIPSLAEDGFELEYIEYVKEGNNYILRIVIDKKDGIVNIDDCEFISRKIEDEVDKAMKGEYVLEVSSPGVERQLKNIDLYKKYCGLDIYLKLFKKAEFGKEIEANLKDVNIENEEITIVYQDKEYVLKIADIASAHTVYDFKDTLKGNKDVNMNKLNKFNKKG